LKRNIDGGAFSMPAVVPGGATSPSPSLSVSSLGRSGAIRDHHPNGSRRHESTGFSLPRSVGLRRGEIQRRGPTSLSPQRRSSSATVQIKTPKTRERMGRIPTMADSWVHTPFPDLGDQRRWTLLAAAPAEECRASDLLVVQRSGFGVPGTGPVSKCSMRVDQILGEEDG
jgi:hypothetical protein